MPLRRLVPAAVPLLCAIVLASPSRPAPPRSWKPAQPPKSAAARAESASIAVQAPVKRPVRYIGDGPGTGQFLPDTVLLAGVEDRTIHVRDYVEAFFNSYAEYRPRPDSAGRIEFLNSMINKEILGLTALGIDRPLSFEDRVTMREHTQRVLSNLLYGRAVLESVTVSEDEIREVHDQMRYRLRLRHIQFPDRATAERVRRDLVAGRIRWKDAVRKHSIAPDRDQDGDLGWRTRLDFDPALAPHVFALEPGELSPVVMDAQGYQVVQCLERRPERPPALEGVRSLVRGELGNFKRAQRAEAVRGMLRDEIGMTHDTTNIEWASSKFVATLAMNRDAQGPSLEFNTILPDFAPSDTGRVLARHRYGQLTLGAFMASYSAIQPLLRPSVNDFEAMRSHVEAIVLEPHMAELAVRRGLDKDPQAIHQIESRREEILVDHLYQDSVMSKVWVKPEERRKYYQQHLAGFVTYPKVTYAAFARNSRPAADSLAERLRLGEKAEDVLRADSLLGQRTGSLQERSANEQGSPYYKLLFEELRPGRVSVQGPDRQGGYAVIQLLTFDPGRQLAYEEVEHIIDESLQNIRAEEMLKTFLARHRKRYRIEAHPELLSRVRMVDPTLSD